MRRFCRPTPQPALAGLMDRCDRGHSDVFPDAHAVTPSHSGPVACGDSAVKGEWENAKKVLSVSQLRRVWRRYGNLATLGTARVLATYRRNLLEVPNGCASNRHLAADH